jgi:hypothetical protein
MLFFLLGLMSLVAAPYFYLYVLSSIPLIFVIAVGAFMAVGSLASKGDGHRLLNRFKTVPSRDPVGAGLKMLAAKLWPCRVSRRWNAARQAEAKEQRLYAERLAYIRRLRTDLIRRP